MEDNNNPNSGNTGSGSYGSNANLGSTGSGSTSSGVASGTSGVGAATGSANSDNAISGLGANHGSSSESAGMSAGVLSLLERFGVTESQLSAVRDTLKNVNLEESLDKAKEQVSESMTKARDYARQNPGAVAAGLAVLVIGAGLLAGAAMRNKDKD